MSDDASTKINIDPDDLTLNEVERVEEMLGGQPIDAVFAKGKPRAAALKALLLVVTQRTDPDATLDTVGDVKLSELTLGE